MIGFYIVAGLAVYCAVIFGIAKFLHGGDDR